MSKLKNVLTEDIVLPKGFKACGIAAGLKKKNRKDLALIYSEAPAVMAGTFTTNQVKAATVKLCRKRIKTQSGRAIVINSGNANACTGAAGMLDAERMAQITAEGLGVKENSVFVCSTGRIGVRLPMEVIEKGIRTAAPRVSREGGTDAAEAIMTTDTKIKHCTVRFQVDGKPAVLAAMAKGAGMIEPNMATMLAFLMTDVAIEQDSLQECLSGAVEQSFNRITVDGDRSTNDTVLFMANGQVGNKPLRRSHSDWEAFTHAVHSVTMNLALKMVADGEGATKLVTIKLQGARNSTDADLAARAVANSLLVKTSWAGDYPNWGRIMDALGYSKARVDEERVDIHYDDLPAALNGLAAPTPLEDLKRIQRQKAFTISINLHLGDGEAVVYSCDCTEEYVRINM